MPEPYFPVIYAVVCTEYLAPVSGIAVHGAGNCSGAPSPLVSGPQLGWHSAKWHHCKGKSNLSVATCKEKFKLSVLSILLAKYTQKCLMKSTVWLCLDNSMQAFVTIQDANQAQESHGLLAGHVPETGPRNSGIRVWQQKSKCPQPVSPDSEGSGPTYTSISWAVTPHHCKTEVPERRTQVCSALTASEADEKMSFDILNSCWKV